MRNIAMFEISSITGGCTCDAKKGIFETKGSSFSLFDCAKVCGDLFNISNNASNGRFYTGVIVISTAVVASMYFLSRGCTRK